MLLRFGSKIRWLGSERNLFVVVVKLLPSLGAPTDTASSRTGLEARRFTGIACQTATLSLLVVSLQNPVFRCLDRIRARVFRDDQWGRGGLALFRRDVSVPCILSNLLVVLLCYQLGGIGYLLRRLSEEKQECYNNSPYLYYPCESCERIEARLWPMSLSNGIQPPTGRSNTPAPPQGCVLAVFLVCSSCSRLAVAALVMVRGTEGHSRTKSINPLQQGALPGLSANPNPSRLTRHHTCPCHQIMSLSSNLRHHRQPVSHGASLFTHSSRNLPFSIVPPLSPQP